MLNELSIASLQEVGVDITVGHPKAVTDEMIRAADLVVILGRQAHLEAVAGTRFQRWNRDEPSERGIDGIERMRLVRDDIAVRVRTLTQQLGVASGEVDGAR